MTWTALRVRRRLEITLSDHSSDTEMLACVIELLKEPDYDVVDRALVNAALLTDYDVLPELRVHIVLHLAGLFTTRPHLRIAVLYRDIAVGQLGGFVEEFRCSTGFDLKEFADRAAAEAWLL